MENRSAKNTGKITERKRESPKERILTSIKGTWGTAKNY